MAASLTGVELKLRRADRHIAELRALLEPVAAIASNSIVSEPDVDPSKLIYRVMDVPPIDPAASVIIGDVLHNLRSALDHLAGQLLFHDSARPPTRETQFPIYESAVDRKGLPRDVTIKPGIRDKQILAALKDIQPYARGHEPAGEALWIVHQLNIIDKHRLLLTVVHAINLDRPAWYGLSEGDPQPAISLNVAPLNGGDVVATFDFEGAQPPAEFDPHLALTVTIDEPEGNWLRGREVCEGLAGLRRLITTDINVHFVPILGSPFLAIC